MSDSLWPHESQHARPPCPSPTPGVHSDSCPSSQWCHQAISSSVIPFSSCPQSLPASESFSMSQLFSWGGQSTGVSVLALFLSKKSQGCFPSEWTGWISLQSKGLSRVFSNMARGSSFLYSSDLVIPHFLTSVLIQVLECLHSLDSDIHHHCSVFFAASSIPAVPNLFGTRDWYCGRQFLHGLG